MNKKRLGICFLAGSALGSIMMLFAAEKLFPDINLSQAARHIIIAALFLYIGGVTLIIVGMAEEAARLEGIQREAKIVKTQKSEMTEDEQLDDELKRVQEKYELSDEEVAAWRKAEEQRRKNPLHGRKLDL